MRAFARLEPSRLAVLVAVLLAAFLLRIIDLDRASVWHDEGWSIRAVRDPVETPDDNTRCCITRPCTCSRAGRGSRSS